MLAVFWNAARGDPNPNCLIAKFRSNYSCFVQHAINVRPFQYPHDSPRRHIWAAFKCSLVQLPLLPPGQLSREIYSSQQNGSHCTWLPCTGWLECKLQHCTVCCFGGNCTIARGAPAAQFYNCIGCLEAQSVHIWRKVYTGFGFVGSYRSRRARTLHFSYILHFYILVINIFGL